MSRLQLLGSYLARGRLPWWWHVGNGLVLWLAIVVGAGAPNFNQGFDLKRTMVMVVLILVGHTVLAGAVVLARWRRAQHEPGSLRPSRGH